MLPTRATRALFLVTVVVMLASCTGDDGKAGTPTGPSPQEVEQARSLIQAVSLDDDDSIDELQGIRFTQAGAEAAKDALASGATGAELWAATWVYATSGTDPAVLRPLLSNDDPSIGAMAAAALVSLGDASGFEQLVALLPVDDLLEASHPPMTVGGFAASTLERYTGQALGPAPGASPEEVAAGAQAWSAWLEQNGAILRFDETTGVWAVG